MNGGAVFFVCVLLLALLAAAISLAIRNGKQSAQNAAAEADVKATRERAKQDVELQQKLTEVAKSKPSSRRAALDQLQGIDT